MKIVIKETGKEEILKLIDRNTGVNYANDFVASAGRFDQVEFVWDRDSATYINDSSTFEWWSDVICDNQALDDRIHKLVDTHGWDAVMEIVSSVDKTDIDFHASAVNAALDEVFNKQGYWQ